MGMISEVQAEIHAVEYEEILLAAIDIFEKNIKNNSNIISGNAIIVFSKEYIYPKYQWELGDAWRTERTENQIKIEDFFEKH